MKRDPGHTGAQSGPAAAIPVKARDAVWTVALVDPLVAPLVARINHVGWITPNLLTFACAISGLAAGVAFAFDGMLAGALLFQLSFIFDCMDGKLAAIRTEGNPLGGLFDVIADTVRLIACAVGLMIGVGGADGAAPLLMAYVSLRFGVMAVAEARQAPRRTPMLIVPTFSAFIRQAPSRAAPPGTTVDVEALVFTIGPIAGIPVVAAAIGAGIELLHLVMYVVQALQAARRRSRSGG